MQYMYKIISFDERRGSIMLQFDHPPVTFRVVLPLKEDGNYMVGEELHQHILDILPAGRFKRLLSVDYGIANIQQVRDLVGTVHRFEDADVYTRVLPVFAIKDQSSMSLSDSDLEYIKFLIDEAVAAKDNNA